MKILIFILSSLITAPLFAQDFHGLSLEEQAVPVSIDGFKIIKVIDGRKDKSNIGWVQTGAFNKRRTAAFENPFTETINAFVRRSLTTSGGIPVVARVTRLYISEQTKAMSETSKAEVAMDYFLKEGEDEYYFITRTYNTVEQSGMDVTRQHPENIAAALIKGFEAFSRRDWPKLVNKKEVYTMAELMEGAEVSPDLSTIIILNAGKYTDGVFTSFDEFINNAPSITSNFEVKTGKNVKLWVTREENRSRVKEGIYGFAHEDQLYILFHKDFYPLEKRADGFYFTGPHIPDQSAVTTGALLGGAIGGAIAASTSGGRKEYKIDLITGGLRIVGEVE